MQCPDLDFCYHFPVKGTRTPWRNADSSTGPGNIQWIDNELRASCDTGKLGSTLKIHQSINNGKKNIYIYRERESERDGSFSKRQGHRSQLKELPTAKVETVWARK